VEIIDNIFMNNERGKLIVFYGTNNLGKSTQAKILIDNLESKKIKAEYLKYPLYNLFPSGKIINEYLREGNPNKLSAREAQIIYTLNRTQHQKELIEKLENGINIVAEDYTGTGIAWGIGAGIDQSFLEKINDHLIKEDLAILFDGERFKESIESNHKHEEDDSFSKKVRDIHLLLGKKYGWEKIDANLSIKEISEIILNKIIKIIK
jgi:thymidylate kinase